MSGAPVLQMSPPPEAVLQAALADLKAGRAAAAHRRLAPLARTHPRLAGARYMLGLALERLGDPTAAIAELRAATILDKRQPTYLFALGDALAEAHDADGAERAFRAALAVNRRFGPAALALAELLLAAGRPVEALRVTTPLAVAADADPTVLTVHGRGLTALGRGEEALAVHERVRAATPGSSAAEHNVAAALGDLQRFAEAEGAARAALAQGSDAPATWLVLARALQGQSRLDPAEAAYGEALRRSPGDIDVLRGAAQLRWMRSGDLDAALVPVRAALASEPNRAALHLLESGLRESAGDAPGAYAAARAAASPDADAVCHLAAARAALRLDAAQALGHAEAAVAKSPADPAIRLGLCEALLANGRADAAAEVAGRLHRERPQDQHVLACLTTAWRLLGDPRYGELCDYDVLVRASTLHPPDGWASLEVYLSDLGAALRRLHAYRAPPLGQSVRGGGQTGQDLRRCEEPAVRAFFAAIDAPVRAYISRLGPGRDPLRSRNLGGYAVAGAWSVRLRPGGGRHVNHIHHDGWLSSAFYVDAPPAARGEDRQGWLSFGEPGAPTVPALGPEHAVRPQAGRLVLFPSYMWHGVTPFGGEAERLTLAFDLVSACPAKAQ